MSAEPASSTEPAASAQPKASAEPVASAQPKASAQAGSSAVVPGGDSEAGETVTVRINITPEGSKIVLKGEEIGRTPMTMEIPRGEKRVFEVNAKATTRGDW
jgi:hypothetical protein